MCTLYDIVPSASDNGDQEDMELRIHTTVPSLGALVVVIVYHESREEEVNGSDLSIPTDYTIFLRVPKTFVAIFLSALNIVLEFKHFLIVRSWFAYCEATCFANRKA